MSSGGASSSSPADKAMPCDQAGPGSSPDNAIEIVDSPRAGSKREGEPAVGGEMASNPESLVRTWKDMPHTPDALLFYGHSNKNEYGYLSNFYVHEPFAFEIPAWCGVYAGCSTAPITFAEKAIMLCKASLMGDTATYARIEAAATPGEAKKLGRAVVPWHHERWQGRVCDVARSVLEAKFRGVETLGAKLLATGDRLIAEAAPRDKVWGIGLGAKSESAARPGEWKGANVLGWALMRARDSLRTVPTPEDDRGPCKRAKVGV